MKIYSIGRDVNCNIVINDNTDVISRRHAILNVAPSGKMTIVDQSHNGTYVNGIRIQPNVPVPVTRKDNVSFAHVARLDWNMVPKETTPLMYAIVGVVALLVIVGAVFAFRALSGGGDDKTPTNGQEMVVAKPDSSQIILTPEQIKQKQDSTEKAILKNVTDSIERKRIQDSIADATKKELEQRRVDSIAKAKRDSIAAANKNKCKYCGKPLSKCPTGGKIHNPTHKPKPTPKDSTNKRF